MHVIQLTGHKNTDSLNSYHVASEHQQREMSSLLNKQQEYKIDFTLSNKKTLIKQRPVKICHVYQPHNHHLLLQKNVSAPNSKSNISIHISPSASVCERSPLRKCMSLTSKEDCIGSLFNGALLQNNVININIAPKYYNRDRRRYVFDDSSDEE